jgi:hypothetical protein
MLLHLDDRAVDQSPWTFSRKIDLGSHFAKTSRNATVIPCQARSHCGIALALAIQLLLNYS